MNKKAIGIDHCKFNLVFKTQQNNLNQVIPIISPHHFEFGEILTERRKLVISLCLPKYFEIHNAVPFKMNQIQYFDIVVIGALLVIKMVSMVSFLILLWKLILQINYFLLR